MPGARRVSDAIKIGRSVECCIEVRHFHLGASLLGAWRSGEGDC
jgi:hypothetical protein